MAHRTTGIIASQPDTWDGMRTYWVLVRSSACALAPCGRGPCLSRGRLDHRMLGSLGLAGGLSSIIAHIHGNILIDSCNIWNWCRCRCGCGCGCGCGCRCACGCGCGCGCRCG